MIDRKENVIYIGDEIGIDNFRYVLSAAHHITESLEYREIRFDFTNCLRAKAAGMLPICALARELTHQRIDASLALPKDERIARLFCNCDWAHLIEPRRFESNKKKFLHQLPTLAYGDSDEQQAIVTRFVETLLGKVEGLERSSLGAVEWAMNEITDNVMNHANARDGGLVMMHYFSNRRRAIDFTVCDMGRGIPNTLREALPHILSDREALVEAVKEGVTRNKTTNAGNGLFGAFEICRQSGGSFDIFSGYGSLHISKANVLEQRDERIPFKGTLVHGLVDLSDSDLLAKALRFDGKTHRPVDHIERKYESDDLLKMRFSVKTECPSVGSRVSGKRARVKLENLMAMTPSGTVIVDFEGINIISSSFADEVFGMLFVRLNPTTFMRTFQFTNATPAVLALIDRAVSQRMRQASN